MSALIEQVKADFDSSNNARESEARSNALKSFIATGLPTPRVEDWKYTDLTELSSIAFKQGKKASTQDLSQLSLLDGFESEAIFFVNGQFYQRAKATDKNTVELASVLSEADNVDGKLLTPVIDSDHPFLMMNTALVEDGISLTVPKNTRLEKPLYLVFVTDASDQAAAGYPRVSIDCEPGSQATVIEHYVSSTHSNKGFANAVSQIHLQASAKLSHVRLQDLSVTDYCTHVLHANLKRDSQLLAWALDLGGRFARADVTVSLSEQGADCQLYGLYMTSENRFVDNHTRINHDVAHCTSKEFYKGILSGRSKAVFNGSVYVAKDAQKTSAWQQNPNLLLSAEAEVYTKPELQIYADDVKCAHGATVGRIDEASLFYLRSRGIDKSTAKSILVYAFALEILSELEDKSLSESIKALLIDDLFESVKAREQVREFLA